MRAIDRIELIDKIGRVLQSRYTFDDIDQFLAAYGVARPEPQSTNSKWVYSKAALRDAAEQTLFNIADELGIPIENKSVLPVTVTPPRNWRNTTQLRVFVSHISKDKDKAMRLRECLAPHGISAFVAHEDILPTLEWQSEIERALRSMDAFVAIHTPGFSKSVWTQQEIGFAVARDVKIISVKMGEDPTGFISKQQALPRRGRTAEEVARELVRMFVDDTRTAPKVVGMTTSVRSTNASVHEL